MLCAPGRLLGIEGLSRWGLADLRLAFSSCSCTLLRFSIQQKVGNARKEIGVLLGLALVRPSVASLEFMRNPFLRRKEIIRPSGPVGHAEHQIPKQSGPTQSRRDE